MMRRLRRNETFRLEAPRQLPATERRSIAGLTTLGLIINPKTKEPVLATTDGEYVSIRSLQQDILLKKLGTGYHSTSREPASQATGFPRVHTPDGVKVAGMGYGTALYSALCDGAHLEYEHPDVRISMSERGDGICSDTDDRSSDADRWWAAAHRQGLTQQQTEEESEREEDVDLDLDADDLNRCASVDGEVVYVNKVNVDIEKTTEKIFDLYSYESLTEHHLVAAEVVHKLPGVVPDDADLSVLWRAALEDPDIIVSADPIALLALDVRGLSEDVISLLSLALLAAEEPERAVDDLRHRWERGLDPGASSGQGRLFRANGMADVLEARRLSGWDELSSLP